MDLPEILSVMQNPERTHAQLQLAISPELDGFDGHFEGVPIVPGVLQIYWALQLTNQYLQPVSAHVIAHMEAIKFQHVMTPNIEVLLDLKLENSKLAFAFSAQGKHYSSGKIAITL